MPNILIFLIDAEVRYKTASLLKKETFDIFETDSFDETIDKIKSENFDAIVVGDSIQQPSGSELCKIIREETAEQNPAIIYLCNSNNISIVENLFTSGANTIVSPPFKEKMVLNKIKEALGSAGEEVPEGLKPPQILKDVYDQIIAEGKELGDVSEIFSGIATRDNSKYLSEVRRTDQWKPIISHAEINPFEIGETQKFVFYEPRMLLRVPREEIMKTSKVIVGRNAPPIIAAIDRDRMLTDLSVYNIVPVEGLTLEYICAYLNSRIMDFFFRRIRPLKTVAEIGSVLRTVDLEAIPIIIPSASTQKKVTKIVRELEANQLGLRSKPKKIRALANMHKMLFDIFGFNKEAVDRLTSLNF